MIPANPQSLYSRELGTFIPKNDAIIVGIINTMDTEVSCFMMSFTLLEMTEA